MKLRQWSKSSRELSNDWTGTSLFMSPFGYHWGNSKPVTYRGHTGSEPKLGLRSMFAFLAIYNTILLRMQPSDPATGTAPRNALGIQSRFPEASAMGSEPRGHQHPQEIVGTLKSQSQNSILYSLCTSVATSQQRIDALMTNGHSDPRGPRAWSWPLECSWEDDVAPYPQIRDLHQKQISLSPASQRHQTIKARYQSHRGPFKSSVYCDTSRHLICLYFSHWLLQWRSLITMVSLPYFLSTKTHSF